MFTLGVNSLNDLMRAAILFIGITIVLKIIQLVVLGRLKKLAEKTATDFDDTIIAILQGVKPMMYVMAAFFFSAKALTLPGGVTLVIDILFLLSVVYEVVFAVDKLVVFFLQQYLAKDGDPSDEAQSESIVNVARVIIKGVLWFIGSMVILSNVGVNITSLIAGMGIGGIAIALAVQSVLGDMFSSFSIYLDKPFRVGDYIVVGSDSGVVEQIGLKSTRLKTLQGEQLIISNKELTSVRVQNFKQMEKRRVVFTLGIEYGTPVKKLEAIPGMIREIIAIQDNADFDRSHFRGYGDFSLDFETVFYVNSSEYAKYMDILEKINLSIYERFEKEGLSFAFPTQTIHIVK